MKDIACFCITLPCLWKQMVQAYKYIYDIFLVTHAAEQQDSDCDRKPTKMDVTLLEEQYDCTKQKQKLQTHIIVFKTGENQPVPGESMISAIVINKKMRKPKEFKEHIPVKKVTLELTYNGNVQDSSPWRTHLGIHRLLQAGGQKAPSDLTHCKNEQISFNNERLTVKENVTVPYEKPLTASEQSTISLNELGNSNMLNSPTEEKSNSISGICQKSTLKSVSSAIWTHPQVSHTRCIPISSKLSYYPFPQKKTPRISEAARSLGLYVSP
ncbi:uncharacterized protein C9orf152 homolog isoform X2 [Carettochelys insculpta]|uniref:uncharacterized protein C9orf152 homolog isoform X2 n=1 Tax=Carettochelys insculpta TaxID=44489 RepID=UPI003EC004A9